MLKTTKRGSLDNIITYEHFCDTIADLQSISYNTSTLGSVAIVLAGDTGLEVYMANGQHEWQPLFTGGGGGGSSEGPTADNTILTE